MINCFRRFQGVTGREKFLELRLRGRCWSRENHIHNSDSRFSHGGLVADEISEQGNGSFLRGSH